MEFVKNKHHYSAKIAALDQQNAELRAALADMLELRDFVAKYNSSSNHMESIVVTKARAVLAKYPVT